MKIEIKDPPRTYECGFEIKRTISDCGRVELNPDEQITLTTPSGTEYDIARKEFGYYATPSTNGRLQRFGLRTVIAKNRVEQLFVLLIEQGKEAAFEKYLQEEQMTAVCWIDSEDSVAAFLEKFAP